MREFLEYGDPSDLNRRQFLAVEGLALLGLVFSCGTLTKLAWNDNVVRPQLYGRLIEPAGKGYRFVESGKVLSVELIPYPWEELGKAPISAILLRREPSFRGPLERPLLSQVDARFGVRVFGARYKLNEMEVVGKGVIEAILDGEKYLGGQWLKLTDKAGTALDPYTGSPLNPGEKPFYTANDFRVV